MGSAEDISLAQKILDEAISKTAIKRYALWLDQNGTDSLRSAILEEGRRRGVFLDDDAQQWSHKKILRRVRGREQVSRQRKNPIRLDEPFTCEVCGESVSSHGRTARNHCPYCLASKHVDVIPGDRAASCGGQMPASHVSHDDGAFYLVHTCDDCGFVRRNRVLLDGDPPDNWKRVTSLSKQGSP